VRGSIRRGKGNLHDDDDQANVNQRTIVFPRRLFLLLLLPFIIFLMTVYSQSSSSQHSRPAFHYNIVSDDETSSVEVLLAAGPVATASYSNSGASSSHSSSFAPRSTTRQIIYPPETVVLEPQPSIVPYAQLCFNQEFNTMSTMLVGTKMNQAQAPNLTFSSDDDEDSHSGWSTGYSSDDSDSLEDYHHHRSHGVVWISREWWTRGGEDHPDANDGRALLPELRMTHSSSSEESTASFLSLKSCGKLFFCHLRGDGGGAYHKSSENHTRGHQRHHPAMTTHSLVTVEQRDKKKDHRFYGYKLLKG